MPTVDPIVLKTMRRLDRLETHVRTLQATPRLHNSSVEGGSLLVRDDAGNTRVVIGAQDDGAVTVKDVGGNTPPTPSIPLITAFPGGITVMWDGTDEDGNLEPWDSSISHVSVRMSPTSGAPGIEIARLSASSGSQYGGSVSLAQDPEIVSYITLVAVRRSGVASGISGEAEAISAPIAEPVDLGPLNDALDALQADLDAAEASLATLNDTTIPGLNTDLATLDGRLDTAEGSLANLNDTVIPGLDSALAGLDGRLDTAEADIDTNASAISTAQAAISAAQASLNTLNTTTIPGLQTDLDAAEADVDGLQAKFPITAPDIAANAVTTAKLDALAVTAAKIAANTITAAQIAAHTITAAEIAADTITANEIAANAITTLELAANAVTAAKIAADTITSNEIAANAITTLELAANAVTAAKIAANTITAAQIAADTITSNEIAANAITTTELAASAVTATKIASHTITALQIAADTITATEIAASAITATEIAADAVTAVKIAADAVLARNIKAGEIQTNHLQAGAVTADKIAAGTLEAGFVLAGRVQVGIDTWSPNEGMNFPGRLTITAPYAQVVTISGAPTGGTFTLTANGVTTSAIAYNAAASTVQTAVRTLGGAFANANVTGSAGGPWTVDVPPVMPAKTLATTSSLTGGTSPTVVASALVNPPTFTGGITATNLTVQKDFNLLGNTNSIAGTLTLSNGITRPTAPPSAAHGWTLVGQRPAPFGSIWYGLTNHLTDSSILLGCAAFFGGAIEIILKSTGQVFAQAANNNSSSTEYRAWCVGFNPVGGITTLGSNYYVLGYDSNRSNAWYIYKLDSSFNKVGEALANAGTFPGRPTIGNDGTRVLHAYADGANSVNTGRWNATTLAYEASINLGTYTGIGGSNLGFFGESIFDFGVGNTRDVIAVEGNANFVCQTDGNRLGDVYTFPPAGAHGVRGMYWDGTQFWSLGSDGTLFKHGRNTQNRTLKIAYTWADRDSGGTGQHETEETTNPLTFTQYARTTLTVTTPDAPNSGNTDSSAHDKANQVGIYVAIGADSLRRQTSYGTSGYLGVNADGTTIRTVTMNVLDTGTANPPSSNGFVGAANSPGIIKSFGAAGSQGFILNGDGSGQWGKFKVSAAGALDDGYGGDIPWTTLTLGPGKSDGMIEYCRVGGHVSLNMTGTKSGTSGTVLATLPVGCRPSRQLILPCVQGGGVLSGIYITTDGNIRSDFGTNCYGGTTFSLSA